MKATVIEFQDLRSSPIRFSDPDQLDQFLKLCTKKKFTVYIIDCKQETAPAEDYQPKKGHIYWCPYCSAERKFNPWYDYRRCEICNITDFDFYVRKYNHLDSKG